MEFIRLKQQEGKSGDAAEVVQEYNAGRDPEDELFEYLTLRPGQVLVFCQHFPHAGSLANGKSNLRAHVYFCTRHRRAPVDSVTLLFSAQE